MKTLFSNTKGYQIPGLPICPETPPATIATQTPLDEGPAQPAVADGTPLALGSVSLGHLISAI